VLLLICFTAPTDSNVNWTLIDHVSKHEVIEPYVPVDKACLLTKNLPVIDRVWRNITSKLHCSGKYVCSKVAVKT